jgi:hypothetical protein
MKTFAQVNKKLIFYLDILDIINREVSDHKGVLEVLGVVSGPMTAQSVVVLQRKYFYEINT